MPRRPSTQLRLLQAMILIAAIACGLAAARAQHARGGGRWPRDSSLGVNVINGGYWAVPILSVALVGIETMSGTTWRRLARQPGGAACLAIVVTTVGSFAHSIILALTAAVRRLDRPRIDLSWMLDSVWVYMPYSAPYAVAAAWLILALSGRWRRGRGWVDACGILCGPYFLTRQWLLAAFC